MPMLEAAPNTPQWVAARRGCLTASRMKDVLDVLKNGKPGAARGRYLIELVAERMSGVAVDHFVTPAMQWGIDNEAGAVEAYEAETGIICDASGFYLHDTIEMFGATPDRQVGRDGLIEVKCPTTAKYITWLRDGAVPEEHKPQMLAQLAVTKRKWVDFVAFDPRIQTGPQLFVRRFTPTAEEIDKTELEALKFLAEVDALFDLVTQAAA
ncbi:MAG: YqaJ viral recombinase family protein [Rhodospirillales bacterium]|nr:YqaJ viral recombinase family protein [Rhodospirillales bacterium]